MRQSYPISLVILFVALSGCSLKNLKAPEYIILDKPVYVNDNEKLGAIDSELWPIHNLEKHYITYLNGAGTNNATLDTIALGGAGTAVIGAATGSKSEVYKASAAIIATALGLEEWGNYKEQEKLYRGAVDYLTCAKRETQNMINLTQAGIEQKFTTALSDLADSQNTAFISYAQTEHLNQMLIDGSPRADLTASIDNAKYKKTGTASYSQTATSH